MTSSESFMSSAVSTTSSLLANATALPKPPATPPAAVVLPLVDKRIAAVVFFTLALYLSFQEMLKVTRATFQKKYQLIQFICYAVIFLHSLTGIITTYMIVNRQYNSSTFANMIISCTGTLVYQVLIIVLLDIKISAIAVSRAGVISRISMLLKIVAGFKSLSGLISLIMMFYTVGDVGVAKFYSLVGLFSPTMKAASVLNLAGSVVFVFSMVASQAFFLWNLSDYIRRREETIKSPTINKSKKILPTGPTETTISASKDGYSAKELSAITVREQMTVVTFSLAATSLMICCTISGLIVNHSISLAFLGFNSCMIMKIYNRLDGRAIGVLTKTSEGGESESQVLSQSLGKGGPMYSANFN
jgi:hypothetical protein